MSGTTTIEIKYGSDTATMEWNGSQASAPILLNGSATQYQTADARHRTSEAVALMCPLLWGKVYETAQDALDDGRNPDCDEITIWDDVAYETVVQDDGARVKTPADWRP